MILNESKSGVTYGVSHNENGMLISVNGERVLLTRAEIVRPVGAAKKDIQVGMRLYAGKEGRLEARLRAPKGGGRMVGVIVEMATPGKPALIEVTA